MYGTAKYQLPAGGKSRTSESIWLGLARMLSLGMSFVLAAILSRYMTVDGMEHIVRFCTYTRLC